MLLVQKIQILKLKTILFHVAHRLLVIANPCLCGEITDSLSDDVGKEVRDVIHVLWCG
jgi:hypothetical protein